MTEIYNIRHRSVPSDAVNIMRPGPWGNPFSDKEWGREGCIQLYEHWLFLNPEFVERIRRELRGKDLVCCCWPLTCHGEVIAKVLADKEPQPLPAASLTLARYFDRKKDALADLLRELEKLLENRTEERPRLRVISYDNLAQRLRPHLLRLTRNNRKLWPPAPTEKVEVTRADLLAWREEWMEVNPVEDGTDQVTPFDKYLYGRT